MNEKGYSGKIPIEAYNAYFKELHGIRSGMASLNIHIRQGKLACWETVRRQKAMPGKKEGVNDKPEPAV